MHPGELTLVRIIGQGRWQHPFHEHANHVRVLARDGNLLLDVQPAARSAGPLLFTTTTTPGMTLDGIFYWTGKGLNWDVFGTRLQPATASTMRARTANGYNTGDPTALQLLRVVRRSQQGAREAPPGRSPAAVRSRCRTPTF